MTPTAGDPSLTSRLGLGLTGAERGYLAGMATDTAAPAEASTPETTDGKPKYPPLVIDTAELTTLLDGKYAEVRQLVRQNLVEHASVLTDAETMTRAEFRERVKEVVLMGGGYHTGNWSAVAEFNIKIDPEAAHIVFNESWPVVMVGLDLTHQALATPPVVAQIAAVGTRPAQFVVELLEFFGTMYKKSQGFESPPVHDPCAVAYVIDPTVMTTRRVPLDVELTGALTLGMTVADFRSPPPNDCTTSVAVELDHPKFWGLITDALERIGEVDL